MNKYETLFIVKPDQSEEQVQAVLDRLTKQIEATRGKVAIVEHWGNRRLAYPVRYRGERLWRGYYVLLTYLGGGDTVEEVERNIKILDPTFRYLTVHLASKVDPASVAETVVTHRREHGGGEWAPREAKEAPAPTGEGGEAAATASPAETASAAVVPAETAPAAAVPTEVAAAPEPAATQSAVESQAEPPEEADVVAADSDNDNEE